MIQIHRNVHTATSEQPELAVEPPCPASRSRLEISNCITVKKSDTACGTFNYDTSTDPIVPITFHEWKAHLCRHLLGSPQAPPFCGYFLYKQSCGLSCHPLQYPQSGNVRYTSCGFITCIAALGRLRLRLLGTAEPGCCVVEAPAGAPWPWVRVCRTPPAEGDRELRWAVKLECLGSACSGAVARVRLRPRWCGDCCP